MNTLTYNGYQGIFEYDPEADIFHEEVVKTTDVITFEGRSIDELKQASAAINLLSGKNILRRLLIAAFRWRIFLYFLGSVHGRYRTYHNGWCFWQFAPECCTERLFRRTS